MYGFWELKLLKICMEYVKKLINIFKDNSLDPKSRCRRKIMEHDFFYHYGRVEMGKK